MSESDDDRSSNIVGNDVTKLLGYTFCNRNVRYDGYKTVTQVPVPPADATGTMATVPLLSTTYLPTDRPDGTLRACDRFLPQGNTLSRLSTAQDHPDRPCPHALTDERQRPEHFPAIG